MKTIFESSLEELKEVLELLPAISKPVQQAAEMLERCWKAGNKVMLCGNGGSAADAAHFATEFTCRFKEDRRPYPAMALGVDGGLLTAIGNDYDFREIFSRQVDAFGKPGDVLIGITTSGKSRNVLDAIEMARRKQMSSILLGGKGGGFSLGAADLEILVPETKTTARIQEVHQFILHVLCEEMEVRLPKG